MKQGEKRKQQWGGKQEAYCYRNLPIPGGGYVTGFLFHPRKKGLMYLRTDIGGTYRYDAVEEKFVSLINHVTMEDLSETFPIALAVDDNYPERLYIACGINQEGAGVIAVSDDYGEHFEYYRIPILIHGNLNGRGTGYRLLVDKKDSNRLLFASQQEGLWQSFDRGAHWEKVTAFPEEYLTMVGQNKEGTILFVGCAGITTKCCKNRRGHSLYVSYDDGQSFEPMWQPEENVVEGVKMAGLVAQRYALDENYLYVTFSVMGRNAYVLENGYSCDGGSVIGGRVARYPLVTSDGHRQDRLGQGEEITPNGIGILHEYGFSGIDTAKEKPGLVICSTISKEDGDCIFRSYDYGQTWEIILYDLEIGRLDFRTSYMKPCYNGGHSIIHWMSDLKINPFAAEEAWFNTGTGVFRTQNLMDEEVVFTDWSDGIEETVHLNLYSPPKGEVKVIDILGDLGGFAFRELDKPCDNSFDDEEGNRYITCINADYSDENPNFVVVTPRGNWKGKTKGGLIVSNDQCRTFKRLAMPFGLSDKIDEALHRIEQPNVNSGWVACSPDCRNLVWSVAENIELPVDMVLVSQDGGAHFKVASVYDKKKERKTQGGFKVFADRMDSQIFYGFGDHSDFYVSLDGGRNFYEREWSGTDRLPEVDFSLIDCANKTEVRGETGKQGVFYLALREQGLWKLHYDAKNAKITVKRLSKLGDIFYRVGLGVGSPNGDYYKEEKAIYTAAVIDGSYGFYRLLQDGEVCVRLNTQQQMYGEINSMEGDSQVYGRFYLATGSRGVLYGEKEENACI